MSSVTYPSKSGLEPLVSVVTPVYNGARYLRECIESVLRQSYQNWEYVIVNNRSTDDTLRIAQAYADRDSRIRVLTNTAFLPVIQNWNNALRQISPESKYCKVVHADDLLFPECLSRMVALAEAHPSIGIVGAYALIGRRVQLNGIPYPTHVVTGKDVCRAALLGQLKVFGSPTALLYRGDYIRNQQAFYEESELHADREVCYRVLRDSDFGFVHQVLTYTRVHAESITRSTALRLYTFRVADLYVLRKYGPVYLSEAEYDRRYNEELVEYYQLLARNLLRRGNREFWEYHKTRLREIGQPLEAGRLVWAFLGHIVDRLLNPKDAMMSQVDRMLSKGPRRAGQLDSLSVEGARNTNVA